MENVIIILVVALIIGGIVAYLLRAKKRGETCIGCPHAKQCSSKNCSCGGSAGCGK